MKQKFNKVKMEHHILKEFTDFLRNVERIPGVQRIIPGRIDRQQKGSSMMRCKISYGTHSGLKCMMCKGSTAQELFITCEKDKLEDIKEQIEHLI